MKLKILSQHAVPPSSSVASAPAAPPLLPLTYFDLYWYPLEPVQRVYFYSLPGVSLPDFLDAHLPTFKQALSLTLHRFLLLAGRLVLSAVPARNDSAATTEDVVPCLRYSHGDSVQLKVVEVSSENEFQLATLTADEPKPAALFRELVPPLAPAAVPLPEQGQPVLAIQLSLFPSQGVALGITTLHVAVDGSTVSRFLRTWSTICRCGDAKGIGDELSFDRSVIEDPDRSVARELMEKMERCMGDGSLKAIDLRNNPDILRCTVRLSSVDLENIRRKVCSNSCLRYSSFTLATALVWSTVLKARAVNAFASVTSADGKDDEWFGFACDLRTRLGIPQPYFGNLLGLCLVAASRAELGGPNGLAIAASVVGDGVTGLQGPDGLGRAVRGIKDGVFPLAKLRPFSVAGSPRFGDYGVDFGWGRPTKMEVVSTDTTMAMSIAESPDGDHGGLEMGIVLPVKDMNAFTVLYGEALKGG